MKNRKHGVNQTFETEDANSEMQNILQVFRNANQLLLGYWGLEFWRGFYFFKQIGLMPCA